MAGHVLRAQDLWKSYDGRTDVLQGLDLSVSPGESVLVWGENGSGKTTLLSLLGALDRPDRGSVTVGSRETTGLKERELARIRLLDIGFVFQTHHLIDDLTVEENVALPLRLAKRPEGARVGELLEVFGLTKLASRRPDEISVGESQRVAVARALANGPKLLLADEPTASLDPKGTAAVLEALRLARTTFGTAEVVATHDAEVREIATQEYLLEEGVLRPRSG
ncbi:MAG TPA: ABC transporter ATP-binding protein [Thermoplasmata archaeon]|nr:ABC transporter ATP-binding protein [Thermoplasmata archaeon]